MRALERAGWEVLEANVRIGHDEGDLVCLDERSEPVLVEVKSSLGGPLAPELRVGPIKQASLRRLALSLPADPRFRAVLGGRVPRIDVVAIRLAPAGRREDRVLFHARGAVEDGPRRIRPRGVLR